MRLHGTIGMALLACAAIAQQPNVGGISSMTINGFDAAPYPMQQNVRTSTPAVFDIYGLTNAPFVIVRSANGSLQPGAATFFGDLCDLPLSPPVVVCIDGLQNPVFNTGTAQQFTLVVNCPPVGTPPNGIPLGFNSAYQAAVVDYFSAFGWSLTAATRVTTIQGPTVVNLNTGIGTFGDSGQATVALQTTFGFQLPFYGVSYSTVHVSGDGYMTFGGSPSPDFTPSDSEMNNGVPRIAGMWTDLDQQGGSILRYTVDPTPPGSNPPYILVEFIGVGDAGGLGQLHNMSWKIDNQGFIQIIHPTNQNTSIYDMIVGISPGMGQNPQTNNKNLSTLLLNPYQGGVNESFYEWFGIPSINPYYTLGTNNPFDLYARTLNFLPNGTTTTLPGLTSKYIMY